MTLQEKNQLIHEFMGVDHTTIQVNYIKSWDSLMPVVKKSFDCTVQFQYDDDLYLHYEEELFHPDYTLSEFLRNDIEAMFERVVNFIVWYNKL